MPSEAIADHNDGLYSINVYNKLFYHVTYNFAIFCWKASCGKWKPPIAWVLWHKDTELNARS